MNKNDRTFEKMREKQRIGHSARPAPRSKRKCASTHMTRVACAMCAYPAAPGTSHHRSTKQIEYIYPVAGPGQASAVYTI